MRYCVTAGAMLCLATLLPASSAHGATFSIDIQEDTPLFLEGINGQNHQGERPELIVGGITVAERTFLTRFDLSGISDGSGNTRIESVNSATITLNLRDARGPAGGTVGINAFRITEEHGDWVETITNTTQNNDPVGMETGGATMNSRNYTRDENEAVLNRWAVNGAVGTTGSNGVGHDGFADIFPDPLATTTVTAGQTGDVVFDITSAPNLVAMLNEWRLAGTQSAGLVFAPTERVFTQIFFDSKEVETNPFAGLNETDAQVPVLFLDVTLGPELVDGDVDGDQDVDINDFNIIKANFRQSGLTLNQGDLSGDGVADFADLKLWKDNFPTAGPSGAALASIPEPTALLLAGLSMLGVACTRRRS